MLIDIVEPRRWTIGALECYNRKCDCVGCEYNKYFKENRPCQMFKTVKYLRIMYGEPPKDIVKKALNNKNNFSDFESLNNEVIIRCLDTGRMFKSFDELAKHLKIQKKILITDFTEPVMTFMGKVYVREYRARLGKKKRKLTKNNNIIVCAETGEEFLSQRELAERLHLSESTISKYINTGQAIDNKHYYIKAKVERERIKK